MVEGSAGSDEQARALAPMRIAFVVNNYPPRIGGVELHVRNLARRLTEQGHHVLVVTLSDAPGRSDEDGIEVIRMPEHLRVGDILGFPSLGTTRRVSALLRQRDIDVVSVHTRFFPMSGVGLRSARRAGIPVIHTEHGSDHVASPSIIIRAASRLVDFTVGRRILRGATEVLGVSDEVVAFVGRLSGRRGARVFFNAIDPAPADLDRTLRPHLVFVGRLVPGKGDQVFVDALATLAEEGTAFTAEILGDGARREDVESSLQRRGLSDQVTVRGRVSVEEVSRSLAGAVLVNPSTLSEGFQTTILEALDAGGAVVSYDLPGVRILREQGFPVDLVETQTADAVATAIRDRLRTPWRVHPMERWYWSARAVEYAQLAARVSGRGMADN